MARTQRSGELFAAISAIGIIKDKTTSFGNTTLTAALSAGGTPLVVAAITNFADTDLIRIGAENEYEVATINGAPSGLNIIPLYPTAFDHQSGDAVVEVQKVKLGESVDGGVKFSGMGGDFNAIQAATRRMVYGFIGGHVAPEISFSILNMNLENLATSLGMLETRIQTASSRDRLVLDASKFGEIAPNIGFYFTGVRKDGKNVEVQAWGCEADWTKAIEFAMARGESAPVPFTIRPTSALQVEIW
jgi:hypothetical protein